jgi:hypothetical protein
MTIDVSTRLAALGDAVNHSLATHAAAGERTHAPQTASRSRVFTAVSRAFQTMRRTRYQHHNVENAAAGVYYFDCVGMANYFLRLGAPSALAALRTAEHTRRGYVPSPDHFADYLEALPPNGTTTWRPIAQVTEIAPGDLIVMRKLERSNGKTFVGHAMFAAGAPVVLPDGTFSLDVFDSTGSPHGRDDSRWHDSRTIPKRADAECGSGFGIGAIQLWAGDSGAPLRISWRLDKPPVPTTVVIARALQ